MEAVMKLLSFILICSQFLGVPVFAEAPRWGVDPKTAPYINTGSNDNPEIVQDRILFGRPLTAPEITHEFESFKSDRRYYKTYPYGIMLNPEFSTERFHVAMKIIDHLKERGLVEGGSFVALENLMTRVVRENGLKTRAKRMQHRFDHEIQRLRDPREGIEARMRTYRGMNTTKEQQQEFLQTMLRDFADDIARYEEAQENNKRIKAGLAVEEKQLIEDFWHVFQEGLTQEWKRTNANMTYLSNIQDSHLGELQGLSDEQKAEIKRLGLTPHFFDKIKLALGEPAIGGCNPSEEVNNIIEQLQVFRGEQGRLLALLQELQNNHEEQQEIEEEGETLVAATREASAENFDTTQEDARSLEKEKLSSEAVMQLNSLFGTPVDILQGDLNTRNVGVENETYLRELFGLGENDQFPRTVKEFNRRLEEMLERVRAKGGVLPEGLASAQEIILQTPQPQYIMNETQESIQRKWNDLQNQSVLTYNPQTGQFTQKPVQDTLYIPQAGDVRVSIQRGGGFNLGGDDATSIVISSVSGDGKQLKNVWYDESATGSGVRNDSHSLEKLQRQMQNNMNSNQSGSYR